MIKALHLQQLHSDGYCIVSISDDLASAIKTLHEEVKAFFRQSNAYKDQFRTPSLQGYLTPYPGLHELFEMKAANLDVKLTIPKQFAATAWAVYQPLFDLGQACLKAISQRLVGDDGLLDMLDDSTFRILHYDRVRQAPAAVIEQFIPAHPDSSLLTLSPKSSADALEIKTKDLQWVNIETALKPNEVMIFAGECLARLTNNYYWSLLHRPAITTMQQLPSTRIATPFFLRARPEVSLDATRLNQAIIGKIDKSIQSTVSVADISDNVNHCRDLMPWKQDVYYQTD